LRLLQGWAAMLPKRQFHSSENPKCGIEG